MGLPLPHQTSPSISTLSLTPGRCRDIDQDMHAIRMSRQDNPYIQVNKNFAIKYDMK
jgi:hypothetical protein